MWVLVLAVGVGACTIDSADDEPCPVTTPSPSFTPPEPFQPTPSVANSGWYGSEDLWTVLSLDGTYVERKSVWWSKNFPGGAVEAEPNLLVIWTRLDSSAVDITNDSQGTNAHTVEDGDFMIGGFDPRDAGCWEVTATYKGATLSYVYEAGT